MHGPAKEQRERHQSIPADRGAPCGGGCGAGSELRSAVHYHAVSWGPEVEHYDGVLRMLDILLSSETSEAEKRKILQEEYDIQMTRTMEQEVSAMCNLSEGVKEKAMAKGMEQGILSSIKGLMETMGWTIKQAMAALKVPETDRQVYQNLLKKQS